ncbi:MAG TPA: alpha/beta hydrolase [Candidatus Polarisedimenticolaceae bacterium]
MRIEVEGAGPLVVKLAGVAGGVGLYREECDAARAAGFRVAAVDLAGDRADDPAPQPLTWDFLALETARAIDAAGGGPAIVWGTSFGTLVALATAARWPGRVCGLLLCHPPERTAIRPSLERLFRWVERRDASDFTRRLLLSGAFVYLGGWEAGYPGLPARAPGLLRAGARARTPSKTVREKLHLLWTESPGIPAPGLWPRTSIVAGAWDRVAPPDGARRLASRLTGSTLHVMPRTGHGTAWTHARSYNALCVQQLGRIAESVTSAGA